MAALLATETVFSEQKPENQAQRPSEAPHSTGPQDVVPAGAGVG
ncbi:hypothetical protein [Mesorhizobium sp. M4A.F.Ca.ET.050.02.1.1]|nr:hypothetical protein [Mesorhizobium sp. M4A.F.Ca.ET.050.02.1.1]